MAFPRRLVVFLACACPYVHEACTCYPPSRTRPRTKVRSTCATYNKTTVLDHVPVFPEPRQDGIITVKTTWYGPHFANSVSQNLGALRVVLLPPCQRPGTTNSTTRLHRLHRSNTNTNSNKERLRLPPQVELLLLLLLLLRLRLPTSKTNVGRSTT